MTNQDMLAEQAGQSDEQRAREFLAHEFSMRGQPSVALMLRSVPTLNEDGPYAPAIAAMIAFARSSTIAEERLTEHLHRFGKHDGLCARIGGYGYCSCGLEAALDYFPASPKADMGIPITENAKAVEGV